MSNSETGSLAGRTILIAPSGDSQLSTELKRYDARIITWPELDIGEPESYAVLDEAIDSLFGYDWLIFSNVNAVDFFLRRFHALSHETSELDAMRVCAISEDTARLLEESQAHVDLIPNRLASEAVVAAIETYVGGADALRGLNFLIPRASAARDYLTDALEDAGARVDVVTAYRSLSQNNQPLAQLNALLAGGGVDCIAFTSPSTVKDFAQLLDTNDLSVLLKDVIVACLDDTTAQTATEFSLRTNVLPTEFTIKALSRAVAESLGSAR